MDWRAKNREALRLYAELGFRLFPVVAETKAPYVDNGLYEATGDIQTLQEWWSIWPDAAIATPMGFGFDKFIYDVDPVNGGMASHDELMALYGALPETWVCRTGSGGEHHYFRLPNRKIPTRTGLRPGIDIKSTGGYALLPFSGHKSGNRYSWKPGCTPSSIPLADPPTWLIDLANDRPAGRAEVSDGKLLEPRHDDDRIYPHGIRQNTIISLVGSMNRRGMTRDSIVAAMTVEDNLRCAPPLGPAVVEDLVDDQLGRYAPDPEAVLGVSLIADNPPGFPARSTLAGVASPDAGYVEEIVSSLIGKGTTSMLAASWKSGKTFVTYRLVLDALLGRPVFGVFPVPRPLKILVLQMEMPIREDERRLRRLALGAGIDPEVVPELVSSGRLVHYSRPATDLTTQRDIGGFLSFALAQKFDLVLLDSVVAAFSSIDINDNPRVRQVFKDLLNPLSSNGVSNFLLHHFRKMLEQKGAKRSRNEEKSAILGAQTWGAASDRIFTLEGVEPAEGELTPGELMLRISLVGGWAKTEFSNIILHMFDDGDGTILQVEKNAAVIAITEIEQAVKDICLKFRTTPTLPLPDLLGWLSAQGYSRRVAHSAKDVAGQRGHILVTKKKPVVYGAGSL
jgi:hypothetical protein